MLFFEYFIPYYKNYGKMVDILGHPQQKFPNIWIIAKNEKLLVKLSGNCSPQIWHDPRIRIYMYIPLVSMN